MAYTIIRDGDEQVRYQVGPRPLADLLTLHEFEQVERGELVGIDTYGEALELSSPLPDGAVVTLRAPDPMRDLAAIGVPANNRGELVGLAEALRIRKHETDHHIDLWSRPLAEIRVSLAGDGCE